MDCSFGHQIRSYVLDRDEVKDLRTGIVSKDATAVLDGDLDLFIEGALLSGVRPMPFRTPYTTAAVPD